MWRERLTLYVPLGPRHGVTFLMNDIHMGAFKWTHTCIHTHTYDILIHTLPPLHVTWHHPSVAQTRGVLGGTKEYSIVPDSIITLRYTHGVQNTFTLAAQETTTFAEQICLHLENKYIYVLRTNTSTFWEQMCLNKCTFGGKGRRHAAFYLRCLCLSNGAN